jgi:hypothetical protein
MDLAQVAPPPTGLHRRAARDRARQTDVGCANDRKAGIAAVGAKASPSSPSPAYEPIPYATRFLGLRALSSPFPAPSCRPRGWH